MEAEVGAAQVFFCLFYILGGHSQFLVGFAQLEFALSDLKLNLLLSLGEFQIGHGGSCLRGAHLVFTFEPVPDGHVHEYAYVPDAAELVAVAVIDVGVGGEIASGECDMGEIGCTHELGGLAGDIDGVLEEFQLGTVLDGRLYVHVVSRRGDGDVVLVFVGKLDVGIEGKSAELAEEHLGEHESVLCLGDIHLGLVDLDLHLQTVGARGYSLADHLLNIAVELLHHFEEAVGQAFFLTDANYLPVGLVDVVEGVLKG